MVRGTEVGVTVIEFCCKGPQEIVFGSAAVGTRREECQCFLLAATMRQVGTSRPDSWMSNIRHRNIPNQHPASTYARSALTARM